MKLLDLFEVGPPIDNVRGLGAVGASSNIDYLGLRVLVKPSVFLKLATPHPDPRSDYIEKHIAAGEPIGAPFLDIHIPQEWFSDETDYKRVVEGDLSKPARVIGHEGRHRMTAILKHYGDDPVETHLLLNGLRRRHLTDRMIARLNESIVSQTRKLVLGPWFELTAVSENFADGKGPGRPGDSARHGIPKNATLAQLDRIGKGKGRKAQLARWQANMRRGRKRATNEAIAPHGSPENEFEMMKAGTKPAALVNPNTFQELYKPVADQLGWPYQQLKIAGSKYNNYVVGQPGEEKRVQRLAMLVQDMNANFALGIKPDKEYHIEMGRLLGYSKQDIQDFLKRVNLAEQTSYSGAALTVFDIDETLFHTKAKVLVVKDNKIIKELTNQEFNNYELGPGESFDFQQFRDAKFFNATSVPVEKMWRKAKSTLDTIGRRPGSKVIIVTARSDFDDRETFLDTFRKHGLDIDKIHVHRAGNLNLPSGEAKKIIIGQYLATGEFDMVRLFDDAEVNLKSFLSLKQEYPDIKFKAYMVLGDGSVKEYNS